MRDSELLIPIEVRGSAIRLDQALLEALRSRLPSISRSKLKSCFEDKQVLIDEIARPASWTLYPGTYSVKLLNWLSLEESADPHATPSPRGSFLPIVHEDDDLLVLNKLSGVPSVPHSSDETETAVSSALAHFPEIATVGRTGLEPGLLHRLDTGTSGLLAFAKHKAAFARFFEAWKSGQVRKIYRAIIQGDPGDLKIPSTLNLTLAHHPDSSRRMMVLSEDLISRKSRYRGKPLPTRTRLVRLHSSQDLEIEIETGVMHQIRCTLAHLGIPVAGDPIYASSSAAGFSRLALHAWKLGIPTTDGRTLELSAPLPTEWAELESAARLGKR